MAYREEEYLQLAGLQHFAFCRRQWALIHMECQWAENLRTTDGALLHENAHDQQFRESRGDLLILRGLAVHSAQLGISGQCDVVEFRRSPGGVRLAGREGLWLPFPVEYKRGKPGMHTHADQLQLCAQALCLEEMLCCPIRSGALYYGEIRRREQVELTPALREEVQTMLVQMHQLYLRGSTPKVRPGKGCAACSLKELCLPRLTRCRSASSYLRAYMEDTE